MSRIFLFDALKQMKAITENGGTFSFSYRKYDRQRKQGGDMVVVKNAKLRSKPMDGNIEDSLHKLFYTDMDNNEQRVCWQILVMSFNGKTTFL